MNTSAYYGPYTNVSVDATTVPEPNVDASLAPPGCNIFQQFGIANYTGPLPCNNTVSSASVGSNSSGNSNACVVCFFTDTITSEEHYNAWQAPVLHVHTCQSATVLPEATEWGKRQQRYVNAVMLAFF